MSDNTGGFEALDTLIAKVKKLGLFPETVARRVAPLILAEAKRTAAAGTSPDGKPWEPRKADGGRALANAADHLSVRVEGSRVTLVLRGPDVLHNAGTARAVRRQILPDSGAGIPKNMLRALERAGVELFQEIVGAA